MGMVSGNGKQQRADINITPLIDVLLVLLIIFMVIVPRTSEGLNALLPQSASDTPATPRTDLVITIQSDKTVRLNHELVALADLGGRLKSLFAGTASQVVFVRADKDLEFEQIAVVIDIAKGAGLDRVALMTQ